MARRARAAGSPTRGSRPWLPMADPAASNVADQEGDPASVLAFCRRVIAARRRATTWPSGAYRSLPSAEGTWAYARGDGTVVLLNMSDGAVVFEGLAAGASCSPRTLRSRARRSRARSRWGPGSARSWRRRAAGMSVRRRFVLCTTPAQGHTAPLLALARRLVDEGHDVVFFTTPHYADKVAATGASFVPFAEEYDAHDLMVANPERESSSKRGVRGVKDDLRRIFIGPIPGQYRDLRAILDRAAGRRHRRGLHVPRRPAARPRPARGQAGARVRRRHAVRRQQPRHGALRRRAPTGEGARVSGTQPAHELGHGARGAGRYPALRPAPAGRGRRGERWAIPGLLRRPPAQGGRRLPAGHGGGVRVPALRPRADGPLRRPDPRAALGGLRRPAVVGRARRRAARSSTSPRARSTTPTWAGCCC